MVQHRRGADGIDPGLGARRMGQVRTIARGEDQRVRGLQGGADLQPAVVQGKSCAFEPSGRATPAVTIDKSPDGASEVCSAPSSQG